MEDGEVQQLVPSRNFLLPLGSFLESHSRGNRRKEAPEAVHGGSIHHRTISLILSHSLPPNIDDIERLRHNLFNEERQRDSERRRDREQDNAFFLLLVQ